MPVSPASLREIDLFSALDGGPNPASAAAMESSVVYILGQEQLHRLVWGRSEVAVAAIKRLALALRRLVSVVGDPPSSTSKRVSPKR